MSFVGWKQGFKNCFNNSPLGMIVNAPKNISEMTGALSEGDFGKVAEIGFENMKKSCLWYSGSIFGLIDNFTD